MPRYNMEDTIAAVSTPIGEGGIGIVRLSGPDALRIADGIFVSKDGKSPSCFRTYTVHYGHVVEKVSKRPAFANVRVSGTVDEVLLTVMRAPKSYTKEDIVEINCHGGIQAAKKVLDLVMKSGARVAEPGEFTKRAFLNGRIDLNQAEAVLDVIRAKTEASLRVAMNQLEGVLSAKINRIIDDIVNITSALEASIDFPEEELEIINKSRTVKRVKDIVGQLRELIESFGGGMVFREGVLAIICGKPNVGKSSLMNILLKRDRVIVSPIPGTTRDAVEETINLKGIPVRLVDTAGIVRTIDLLERESIQRSRKYLQLADIAIVVLDNSVKLDEEDLKVAKLVGDKKKVVVINKSDLKKKLDMKRVKALFKNDRIIEISVQKKKNIELLEKAVSGIIWQGDFSQGEAALVSNIRHKELLDKSLENMLSVKKALLGALPELIAIDLKEAIYNLGLIVGRSISEDVLDRIFEQFCIGK